MACTGLWKWAHYDANTQHVNNDVVFNESGLWLFWRTPWPVLFLFCVDDDDDDWDGDNTDPYSDVS